MKRKLYSIRDAYQACVFESLLLYRYKTFLGFPVAQQWSLEELAQALIKHGFAEAFTHNKRGEVISLVFKDEINLSAIETALMTPKQLELAKKLAPKRDKVS